MAGKANPALIGAFALGAVALAVIAVVVFGSGAFFKETNRYVAFFPGNVRGLEPGAPVRFRGVAIGTVEEIRGIYDPASRDVRIPVFVELLPGVIGSIGSAGTPAPTLETVLDLGLRAQLATESLITGKLYVDLDFHPDKEAVYLDYDMGVPEIPTIPSTLEEAGAVLTSVMEKLRDLPLDQMIADVSSALKSVDELVSSKDLARAVSELDDTVAAFRRLAASGEKQVGPLGESLTAVAKEAERTLQRVDTTLAGLGQQLGPGSALYYQLVTTLEDVSQAADSLRTLADNLDRQPDSLIFGRGRPGGN